MAVTNKYVFILLFGALVMFLSHLRRLNLDYS